MTSCVLQGVAIFFVSFPSLNSPYLGFLPSHSWSAFLARAFLLYANFAKLGALYFFSALCSEPYLHMMVFVVMALQLFISSWHPVAYLWARSLAWQHHGDLYLMGLRLISLPICFISVNVSPSILSLKQTKKISKGKGDFCPIFQILPPAPGRGNLSANTDWSTSNVCLQYVHFSPTPLPLL